MPESIPAPLTLERDGSSQSERRLPGLVPETVGIDERRPGELLAFSDKFAKELAYFGLDNQPPSDPNHQDWSGFLNPLDLQEEELPSLWDEVEAFVDNPEGFDDDSLHRRPHFVLFLAYLQLLGLSQQRLNRLPREHLNFYYQTFLGLDKQAAQPDHVNILASLSADSTQVLLPKGSLLDAGKDSGGAPLRYATDEDLTVNRAQIQSLFSAFVDKKATGIRQAREASVETQADPMLSMFAIVYGDPVGDPPPDYMSGLPMDAVLFGTLRDLVEFVGNRLFLDFQELRNLMKLKNRRNDTAADDWKLINGTLEIIGKAVVGPGFTATTNVPDLWNFDANLKLALNGKSPDFDSLAGGIKSMEDLYWQRSRDDVLDFINNKLHLALEQFTAMMEKKMAVDQDWRIVNGLLEAAGQRRLQKSDFHLPNPLTSPYFDKNFKDALDSVDFSPFKALFTTNSGNTDLDRFYSALQQVGVYFYCSLEDFSQLTAAWEKQEQADAKKKPSPAEWNRVYAILATAYTKRVYAIRRKKLNDLRTGKPQKDALEAMLRMALGEPRLSESKLLEQLAIYWPKDGDAKTLAAINTSLLVVNPPSLDEQGWLAIVDALELAWRNREGTPPVAQKIEWLNLYTTRDATSVKADSQGGTPRWRTFGQGRQAPAKDQPPSLLLGWSIASPALCLSEGKRQVVLTLGFQADGFVKDKDGKDKISKFLDNLQVEASGAKGWLAPDKTTIASIAYPLPPGSPPLQQPLQALQLELDFDVSSPAITALPGSESPWPLIRILLKPAWRDDSLGGHYSTPYPLFQNLVLERVLIVAHVTGLKDLRLENDIGPIPSGKPFEPFGFNPSAGAGLQFVHPELVVKQLNRLNLNLEWMKVPAANLPGYYRNYPDPNSSKNPPDPIITANDGFKAKISLVDHRMEIKLADKSLFDKNDAGKPVGLELADIPASIQASKPGYVYAPEFGALNLADPGSWQRFWRMELNSPDFQHGNYAGVSAAKSVELAADLSAYMKSGGTQPSAANYKVNPPYTPKLKSFSVDYDCSLEIIMDADASEPEGYGNGEERIYYFEAFGVAEIQPEQQTGLYRFLPSYDYEGELYIGLENLAPPQDVAILFQMAEGSANPDLEQQPVEWSYLTGNQWISLLDGGILEDTTGGLVQSGIIKFRLAQAEPNTLLPSNLYWLRAAVRQDSASLCDTIAIHTQAVSATWVDQGNAQDHLNQPLPAETIRKTVAPLPGIAAIVQPYTSYGGKPRELDDSFNLRVSERLRHKQRAVTVWDYEHLILERFPAIYKAKCIPASSTDPAELGKVKVILIPDIHDQFPFNPFEPKATAGQIAEINAFLADYLPPLAEARVINAYYVPVRVRFAVRFMPGCDPGYYKPRLNDELNRFLSPWAYRESNDIAIGGTIYANAIVDFLERRPYVDYVAELKLFKNEDGLGFKLVLDQGDATGYRVQTDRPDGVLVADRQHDIDLIADARFEDLQFTGIGYMKIELDFIVD